MIPKISKMLVVLLIVTSIVASGCGVKIVFDKKATATAQPSATTISEPEAAGLVKDLQGVQKATIQIESVGTFVDPQFGLTTGAGRGSGFIIDPSGIAVTNNHVVTGAGVLKVWVGGDTSKTYNAQILGVSECSDLAVIKIVGDGFSYLKWYEGPVDIGMEVYTAGYPLGEPEFALTKGIVSKTTSADTSWASIDQEIMHDAKINPGNSGGPLVNGKGEVVGVNFASRSSADQSFAINVNLAKSVVATLQKGKDVESFGINGSAVVNDDGSLSGIWVSSLKSGSLADKAGLQAGDIITSLEGIPLAKDGTMADYCDVLRTHSETDTLSLEVLRFSTGEVLDGQINGRALKTTSTFTSSSGSTSSGSTSTSGKYSFETISDNSGSISLDVPTTWTYRDGGSWVFGSETVGIQLTAAPDSNAYSKGTGPWVSIGASKILATRYGFEDFLNVYKSIVDPSCTYNGREDAAGFASLSIGKQDSYFCKGYSLIILAGVPKSQSFLVFGAVQIFSDADWDVYAALLGTVIRGY